MKLQEFKKIKCFDILPDNLKKDQIFLNGEKMCSQLSNKKINDQISYYKIIKCINNKIEYEIKYDVLTE